MDREHTKESFLTLETRGDVAAILNIPERSLRYFLYKQRPENMYHIFRIPKKDGTTREISAPDEPLKEIQRKLAKVLTAVYEDKVCTYGFIEDKNNVGNAEQHTKKRLVFNIDLKDFFSQIHFGRVRGMLMHAPYNLSDEAATTIAQIACLNGRLPQGAPSSPIITNMICMPLDNALMRLAKSTRCVYTRYADDITFSTYKHAFDRSLVYVDREDVVIGDKLASILKKHSFVVNPQKITLRSRVCRQEVTGLTVNEFPNLRRSYIKQLRAIIHSCEKYGVLAAARVYVKKGLCKNQNICKLVDAPAAQDTVIEWFKQVLVGKVHYIKQVKGARSPTYLIFAEKLNALFHEDIFDITELHRFENMIKNSTFILMYDDGENFVQGSAFYLRDIGILTSYHVTECGAFFKVFNLDTYAGKSLGIVGTKLNEISSDRSIDYAAYTSPFKVCEALAFQCGDSKKLKVGDQVTIIGYPNHQAGNSANIQCCNITCEKNFQGAPFFTVSGRIVHGASGGIVVNSDYEAVGIIKGGIVSLAEDTNNENQGFVPLHLVLEHMKGAAQTQI
jgi:hypothetical protein